MGPDISIILPTYNERENLPILVERLDAELSESYEIIVVDDDSPDRTWEVGESLADEFPVTVIRRREASGLATAVVRGFRAASGDIYVVMDADLQHPPASVPDLIAPVASGASIAVGSRMVDGGSFGSFSLLRRVDSHGANLLAKLLFPKLRSISDLQSGFFAVRREIVDGLTLEPEGYKILLEILVLAEYDEVVEIGYRFRERKNGSSNLDFEVIWNYLSHLWSLSRRRTRGSGQLD